VKLAFLNQSTTFKTTELALAVQAIGEQLSRDVAPAWGLVAPFVMMVGHLSDVPADALPIVVLDHPDQAGALGYHTETPDGRRYGRVFVQPTLEDGDTVSSVLSHEAIEALVDPACNLSATAPSGWAWALEACDPCESDSYEIAGVQVSNFVLPAFFDGQAPKGAKLDFLGKLSKPFSLDAGGYAVLTREGRTRQVQADGSELDLEQLAASKRHPAARTARRMRAA
jgi:hypothetical protein